jgi:hypothetical protein
MTFDNEYREPVSRGIFENAQTADETVRDTALRRAVEEMFSDDDIAIKTDLTKRQILSLARAMFYAEKYDSDAMRSFVHHILTLSVSKNRKSREEFVRLIRASQEGIANAEDETSRFRRILGLGR